METLNVQIKSEHQIKWQVSLSNGETFYEDKEPFNFIADEKSPWNRLIQYTADNKCLITSLSLFYMYKGERRTFNLPSAGNNPKFKAFFDVAKPIDFNFCRHIAMDMNTRESVGNEESFSVIEAIYSDYKLQIWVDDNNPQNCWSLVV
jgi:hypothetical protein